MKFASLVHRLAFALAVLFLPACITVTTGANGYVQQAQGASSYGVDPVHLRTAVLASWAFRGLDLFYGTGGVQAGGRMTEMYSSSDLDSIADLQQNLLHSLLSAYRSQHQQLERDMGRPLPRELRVQLAAPDVATFAAQVSRGMDRQPATITVGVPLVRAAYRATLVAISANADSTQLGAALRGDQLMVNDAEARVVNQMREVRDRIRNLGELNPGVSLETFMQYGSLVDVKDAADEVDRQFIGTLLFALAHELGHVALGTDTVTAGRNSEAEVHRAELGADSLAAALLSRALMSFTVRHVPIASMDPLTGVPQVQGNLYTLSKRDLEAGIGYTLLFLTAFHALYAGQGDFDRAVTQGGYPNVTERVRTCRAILDLKFATDAERVRKAAERRGMAAFYARTVLDQVPSLLTLR